MMRMLCLLICSMTKFLIATSQCAHGLMLRWKGHRHPFVYHHPDKPLHTYHIKSRSSAAL